MAHYEVVVVAREPQSSGPPILTEIDKIFYNGFSFEEQISKPGNIQLGCDPSILSNDVKTRFSDLHTYPTELKVYEDDTPVIEGVITSFSFQNNTLSIYCHGLLYYLEYMFVDEDMDFRDIDQFVIARDLINQWQSLSYGNFGIGTSSIGTSGILRDRIYEAHENPNVATKIQQLSEVINGFDYLIEPGTRNFRAYYPTKGEDKSEEVFLDHRNIADDTTSVSVQAGDLANVGHGTGTGRETEDASEQTIVTSRQVNNESLQLFGRAGIANSWDGVTRQTTIDNHTAKLIEGKGIHLTKPGPGIIPVEGSRRRDFSIGDRVTYSYDFGVGLYTYTPRVISRRVTVSDRDNETMSVGFE